jgi:hypothetical protein
MRVRVYGLENPPAADSKTRTDGYKYKSGLKDFFHECLLGYFFLLSIEIQTFTKNLVHASTSSTVPH